MRNEDLFFLIIFYIVYVLFMTAVGITVYVLTSWSYYTVAKRRGIKNPWLSWIPLGNVWILGSISDQFRYVTKGQVKNKRKSLLVLDILLALLVVAFVAVYTAYVVLFAESFRPMGEGVELLGAMLVLALVALVVGVVFSVIWYMALYDLFTSCEPTNAVLYLVLSIVFGVTLPIFLFICRKKDLGMPPRKETITEAAPQIPAEPVEETADVPDGE